MSLLPTVEDYNMDQVQLERVFTKRDEFKETEALINCVDSVLRRIQESNSDGADIHLEDRPDYETSNVHFTVNRNGGRKTVVHGSFVNEEKEDNRSISLLTSTSRNGKTKYKSRYTSFPCRLHSLLEEAPTKGYAHIVSWQPHGFSFRVHKEASFVKSVMPLYFKQSRFSSFQRQLALYGFTRFNKKGLDQGAYYHNQFVQCDPEPCKLIKRTPIKGHFCLRQPLLRVEPNFYNLMAPNGDVSMERNQESVQPSQRNLLLHQSDSRNPCFPFETNSSGNTFPPLSNKILKDQISSQNLSNNGYTSDLDICDASGYRSGLDHKRTKGNWFCTSRQYPRSDSNW